MTEDFTAVTDEAIQIRHYLHQHPEVADQEVATTAYLRDRLTALGYRIVTPATQSSRSGQILMPCQFRKKPACRTLRLIPE